MSATNHTSNYNLPIYEAGNRANWLVDFNGAMSTIDGALNENKLAGDTLKTDMEELQTDFQQVSTKADAAEQAATQASTNAANALTIANNATTIAGDAQVDAHAALNILTDMGNVYSFTTPSSPDSHIRLSTRYKAYMISFRAPSTALASVVVGNSSVIYNRNMAPVKIAEFTDGPRIRWICDAVIHVATTTLDTPSINGVYIYTDANGDSIIAIAKAMPTEESTLFACANITTYNRLTVPTVLESDLLERKNSTNELPYNCDIILDVNSNQYIGD